MNSQIKQRIEKIKNGKVPDGYKRTKAGIVPNDWKECLFKEMFTRVTRKNQENNTNVLTISAQNGLVSQKEFFNKSIASDDRSNYFLVEHGDYAYNKSYSNGYPYGTIKRLEKYKKGILSPLYICFSPSCNNKCSDFYSQYFEAGLMDREIKTFAQEGARNHGLLNISVEDFFNAQLICPNLVEQKKIAEILATQDKIIELKERKIEELKKLKKYYLNKMFPQKGGNYPEVRFSGFTDPWEQRKLKDIVERVTRKNQDLVSELPLTISAQYGLVDQNEFFDKRVASKDVSGYYLIYKGEFAYNKSTSNDAPWGAIKRLDKYENGVLSTLYIVFKIKDEPEISSDFIATYYDTSNWYKGIRAIAAEGARNHGLLNIAPDDFFKTELLIPRDKAEQQRIGDYFRLLDNFITLQQRELDEEKKLKKSLMQLLLTGIVRV